MLLLVFNNSTTEANQSYNCKQVFSEDILLKFCANILACIVSRPAVIKQVFMNVLT